MSASILTQARRAEHPKTQVSYTDDGARTGPPEPVGHATYFIGKEWSVGANLQRLSYSISHLEILTFSEISNFVTRYLDGYINLIKDEVSWGGLPSQVEYAISSFRCEQVS